MAKGKKKAEPQAAPVGQSVKPAAVTKRYCVEFPALPGCTGGAFASALTANLAAARENAALPGSAIVTPRFVMVAA